jgi:hypothetical protein
VGQAEGDAVREVLGDAMGRGVEGPAVERQIAADLARHGLLVSPLLIGVATAIWGLHGGLSAAYAVGLVLANFFLSACLLSWSARISLAALGAAAMFGWLVRLAIITVAVLVVHDQSWVSMVPLALTLGFTHLGLLVWETRYVSASLAFPGLKPRGQKGV